MDHTGVKFIYYEKGLSQILLATRYITTSLLSGQKAKGMCDQN